MYSSGNEWVFAYDEGRVIPGSSGSPFFDSSKRIRGMASYIMTNYCYSYNCYCNQTYNHGYAKFSSAWTYIDEYLDPIGSGATSIDGTKSRIWGGRFASGPSQLMQDINASISYDQRLYRQDIAGSRAHATMLAACDPRASAMHTDMRCACAAVTLRAPGPRPHTESLPWKTLSRPRAAAASPR